MSRPNILVFLTDDHGHWAMGCAGNREIHSPSMDWLADEGCHMQQAFTPTPVCSPARASFFTGRFPSSHGLHDYIKEFQKECIEHPGIKGCDTLAKHLKASGYTTAHVGKWHCHHHWEGNEDYDLWYPLAYGTNAKFGEQCFYEGEELITRHGHQAPMLTDRALQFLNERDADQPFFMFVGFTDTHTPHNQQPKRLTRLYEDARFKDIPKENHSPDHGYARIIPSDEEQVRRDQNADYYAAVTTVDEQVGRILDELESRGELDNTLIVYTADHGHMNGHHGLHTKGNATIPQNMLEESIRVPLLIRWPGQVLRGAKPEIMVDHTDLRATLMDVAGLDWKSINQEDQSPGQSYLPTLRGEMQDWKEVQLGEYGNARMIRDGRYKLIVRYECPNGYDKDELYDLLQDPRETTNIIEVPRHAATVAVLRTELENRFAMLEGPSGKTGRLIDQVAWCNEWMPWEVTEAEARKRQGR